MNLQPRNDNGWRIPRVGTKSHDIYRLARQGKKPRAIAAELNISNGVVRVSLFRIRNPGTANARQKIVQPTWRKTEYD